MTIITNVGKKLITHAIINKLDLFISKVVYADCNLDTLDENTTTLTNIKYENLPTSVRTSEFDNSKIIFETVLRNDTAQDFFINCVGFIAKNGELLCFTKIKRTPILSKATDTNASLFHYKLAIELKNAKDLSIKIDETIVYPTLAHFNASQKAQDEKIDKLGLDKVNTSDFTASQTLQDEKINALENNKAEKLQVFTRDEINVKLNAKADKTTTYTKAEVDTSQNAQNTKISALETNKADKSTTSFLANARIVKTVGIGGDFADLNAAFNYAGKLNLTCAGDWQDYYLELRLISDITITRQTTYHNPNCHIFINGTKAGGKHTINYDYKLWGDGTDEIAPLNITHSSVLISNVIFKSSSATNKSPNLLQAIRNSYLEVSNCDFVGNGVACRGLKTYHSQIRLLNNSFDNFKWEGILFTGASSAMCWTTSFSNCKNNCINIWEGSNAEISNINLSGINPARFIFINRGSYASITGTINLNGCTLSNIAANTPTAAGLLLYGSEVPEQCKKISSTYGNGDWTIAPVTINKPIFITHSMAGQWNTYIDFYVKSGSNDNILNLAGSRPDKYRLGSSTQGAPSAVIIPTATSVVINIGHNDDLICAYQ